MNGKRARTTAELAEPARAAGKFNVQSSMFKVRCLRLPPPGSRSLQAWAILLLFLFVAVLSTHAQTPSRNAASDLLQFLDGSILRGSLAGVDTGHIVHWRHPFTQEAIVFQPRGLHRVRFMQPAPAPPPEADTPACRLRFANGDEVVGDLLALDDTQVVFKTWFGGELTAPRAAVRSLQFIKGRSIVAYEGPTSLTEWNVGQPAGTWTYRDGVLSATGIGSLGRDVGLPPRGRIELDLDWSGPLSLLMSIYTESTRFDFNASGYMFIFGPGYVTLQRMQGIRGTTHLGQVLVPQLAERSQARIEIRADKEQNALALLVDGAQVHQWTDAGGFAGQGTGVAFLCQRVGPPLNVSNIRVGSWEGAPASTATNTEPAATIVSLVNGDSARGDVKGIREGRLLIVVNKSLLPVPLERVTRVELPGKAAEGQSVAGLVRAELHTGASVTFRIQQWNEREVSGASPHFGNVTLKPEWIRQLVFNLDQSKPDKPPIGGRDDFFWPFEK